MMLALISNIIAVSIWVIACILMIMNQTKILRKQFEINDYLETLESEQRLIRDMLYNFFSRIKFEGEEKPEAENKPKGVEAYKYMFRSDKWDGYKDEIMKLQEFTVGNKRIPNLFDVNKAITLFVEHPDKWNPSTMLYYATLIADGDFLDDEDFRDLKQEGLNLERELVEVTKSRIGIQVINKLKNHEVTASMFFAACALKWEKSNNRETTK